MNQAATTTALVPSPDPSVYGQTVTLTATVTAVAPGAGTPTGTVQFYTPKFVIGTASLVGDVATITVSSLPAGDYALEAQYQGDASFQGSISSTVDQTVDQASTTTSLSLSSSTVSYGNPVTFTAAVTALAPGSGSPTGSVEFFDGGTDLGSGDLAGGTATFTISTLTAGDHQITAQYQGDTNFLGSTSSAQTLTVETVDPYTVSTTADSRTGSLRQAIMNADAAISGPITITFNIPTSDPNFVDDDSGMNGGDAAPDIFVISPLSPLPALNNPNASIIIDGRTQTSFTGDTNPFGPEVVLDGTSAGSSNGLLIQSSGNEVFGLDIRSFSANGIEIAGGSNNWIAGNDIGTDPTGTAPVGNGIDGVDIENGAYSNLIGTNGDGIDDGAEGNVISGNVARGVIIDGAGTDFNVVAGNLIGTDATGTAALPNLGDAGVTIADGAQNNRIGTNADGVSDDLERNVISGNAGSGVRFQDAGTSFNVVAGNYIGTTADGAIALGNGNQGIDIHAPNNTVGGITAASRNVIASNSSSGIYIYNTNATGNLVEGNYIGTDATGTVALGNHNDSITIDEAPDNTVGGTGAARGTSSPTPTTAASTSTASMPPATWSRGTSSAPTGRAPSPLATTITA